MNQAQFTSWVKTTLGFLSGVAVPYGIGTSNGWVTATGIAVGIAPYVWGYIAHTALANAETAAATPGVTVKVGPDAPASLQAAAADPAVPAITKA